MLNRKRQRGQSRSKRNDKFLSPNIPKIAKDKTKNQKKEQPKNVKKPGYKTLSKLQQFQSKNSLFHSLRDLPLPPNKEKSGNAKKKTHRVSILNNEDSTASRQFKQYIKQYNHPNGEYFGSRLSSLEHKHRKNKFTSPNDKNIAGKKKVRSLQKKIKDYRRMSSQHRSQSQSFKSQISDKQMRRLSKMQSIEKMMLMQEIMSLQSKRLHIKTQK